MGFMARLYQRSLAPIWNNFLWLWWAMISGNRWDLRFLTFVLQLSKNPGKTFNQENWPDRGSYPGPLGERQRCYSSTTAVVLCHVNSDCVMCFCYTPRLVLSVISINKILCQARRHRDNTLHSYSVDSEFKTQVSTNLTGAFRGFSRWSGQMLT